MRGGAGELMVLVSCSTQPRASADNAAYMPVWVSSSTRARPPVRRRPPAWATRFARAKVPQRREPGGVSRRISQRFDEGTEPILDPAVESPHLIGRDRARIRSPGTVGEHSDDRVQGRVRVKGTQGLEDSGRNRFVPSRAGCSLSTRNRAGVAHAPAP